MANVIGSFQTGGIVTVELSNLQYPAKNYSQFRHQVKANGVVKSERRWTYYGTTAPGYAQFDDACDWSSWYQDNGSVTATVEAWGTVGGVEYYIGSGPIL